MVAEQSRTLAEPGPSRAAIDPSATEAYRTRAVLRRQPDQSLGGLSPLREPARPSTC